MIKRPNFILSEMDREKRGGVYRLSGAEEDAQAQLKELS